GQVVVARPVDDDRLQAEAGHDQPPDRVPLVERPAVGGRRPGDVPPFGGNRDRPVGQGRHGPDRGRRSVFGETVRERLRQLVLLVLRVQGGERVLTLTDQHHTSQGRDAAHTSQ